MLIGSRERVCARASTLIRYAQAVATSDDTIASAYTAVGPRTDKVMYAGYFPMGLSLDRIFGEMPDVPFRDHVWPKFLRENAMRVFKLDA